MTAWTELDYRLSVVKRWQVVSTIRTQSVAEHQHNVAVIAERIAREWFDIKSIVELYTIQKFALTHDAFEAIMGDPPSYMKPYVDETRAEMDLGHLLPELPMDPDGETRHIVKVADYIDALTFLMMEMSHGNHSVKHHLNKTSTRFEAFDPQSYGRFVVEVVGPMFNGGHDYISEVDGFPK